MSGVRRVFVEKKKPFAVNAKELHDDHRISRNKGYHRCKSAYKI